MFFSNPIWLWALTGLSIPVAIHLLSRKEGKVIYIGSIRHLQETSTQQFKGIRLNELVLLALRCLLIILFVSLLSGLSFYKNKENVTPWVIVERGLENNHNVKSQLEKFRQDGYQIRLLATGFPVLADSVEIATPLNYKILVEELGNKDFSEAVIFSKNTISGFSGLRSSLPVNITWIGVPTEPSEFRLTSYSSNDSTLTRTGYTSSTETYFTTNITSKSDPDGLAVQPLRIHLVADKEHQYDKKIIEAVLRAIEKESRLKIEITVSTPTKPERKYDWLILLADKSTTGFDSVRTIKLRPGIERDILVQEASGIWTITKRLNEEIALNENLTARIASVIIPSNQKLVQEKDRRMVSDSLAWTAQVEGSKAGTLPSQSADTYIIMLLLAILLIERILAYHKNQ
jgi:hypothetical protein